MILGRGGGAYERGIPAPLVGNFRQQGQHQGYRSTSLTRKRNPLGPYRRPIARVLRVSYGIGRFFMSEVPLCPVSLMPPRGFEPQGSLGELVGDHRDAPLQRRLGLRRG